jgi:sugar lactone lactonase YvrE
MKRVLAGFAALLVLVAAYLALWPVPVNPVAWQAPAHPGLKGPWAPNTRLAGIETLPLGPYSGPEDVAVDPAGFLYASTREGVIVRLDPDGGNPREWARTGGRPLGLDVAPDGRLIVADAERGLLALTADGEVQVLAQEADGRPIGFADDVAVARDGRIFFTDASAKFAARVFGVEEGSALDLIEHGGHGRLLVFEPDQGRARTLVDGLQYANGVALSPDQRFLLVAETGAFRVLRYWLDGSRQAPLEVLLGDLPGFPDNVTPGRGGRFWVALVAPRSAVLEAYAHRPFWRQAMVRLPQGLRPRPAAYGHIIAIDEQGRVMENLQDPATGYPLITSVTETREHLYLGSLTAAGLGRYPKSRAGLLP